MIDTKMFKIKVKKYKLIQYLSVFIFSFCYSSSSFAVETIIKNVNIITYENQFKPIYGHVIISGDKIKKVKRGMYKGKIKDINIFDGKNMYLIPGLIDSHNHIDIPLGLDETTIKEKPHLVEIYQKQLPRSYLYFGYTTIIDLFTKDSKIIKDYNTQPEHPDLFLSGGAITELDGYPMNFMKERKLEQAPNFVMSSSPKNNLYLISEKEHSPDILVEKIISNNGIFVKTYYEPGFGGMEKLPLPSLVKVKDIVKQAHKHHLPVIMHANSVLSQKFALEAGVDGVAHGLWNWNTETKSGEIPKNVEEILDTISSKKMGYQATTRTIGGLVDLFDDRYFDNPDLSKVLNSELLAWYKSNSGKWFKNEISSGSNPENVRNKMKQINNQGLASLNYLAKKDAFLLFATDTPSAPTYANPPGLNGYFEMKNWIEAGVSPHKILESATINNAKFFHLDKSLGSITKNKIANLLLLKTNPLNSIEAYNDIDSVVLHGKIYKRSFFAVRNN